MIFVVQYDNSMSPDGKVIGAKDKIGPVKKIAQDYENEHNDDPEKLRWSYESGIYTAGGFGGIYTITEWPER